MAAPLRFETTVQPGGRIEVVSHELVAGRRVAIVVVDQDAPRTGVDALAFLAGLPRHGHEATEWAAIERFLDEERDAWEG